MPRVLLAWEGGGGRGHIVPLRTVAAALGAPEMVDAAVCRLEHADELSDVCGSVFQGAALGFVNDLRQRTGALVTSTWGEFLGDLGFSDVDFLVRQIGWWRSVIESRRIGLVIADFAPCAVLAARTLGVRSVAIGSGYQLPEPDMPEFPVILPEFSERLYEEPALLASVNQALAHFDAPPFARFPQVYCSEDQLVATVPALDAYLPWRRRPHLPPFTSLPTARAGAGDEVFIYASTTELANSAFLEAITSLGLPARMVALNLDDSLRARLAAVDGLTIEPKPIPFDLIAARSRLLVGAAQHGTLCCCIASGLPQVAMPQQLEQELHARRAEELGVLRRVSPHGVSAEAFRDTIRAAWHDEALLQRSGAVADELKAYFAQDMRRMLRDRLDAVMQQPD